MNVFSQSASRGETDSGDDSELSLSIIEKVQSEPFSFGHGQDRKHTNPAGCSNRMRRSFNLSDDETVCR